MERGFPVAVLLSVIKFLFTRDLPLSKMTSSILQLDLINSCRAIAGTIIGLLFVFLFRRKHFSYDQMTSQPLFSFVHAIPTEVRA